MSKKPVLSPQHRRVLSKNLTCQFRNREYQVRAKGPRYTLRRARVTVCEGFNGTVTLLHKGRPLPHRVLARGEPPVPAADGKRVSRLVEEAKGKQAARPRWKPAPDHPWRRFEPAAPASAQ